MNGRDDKQLEPKVASVVVVVFVPASAVAVDVAVAVLVAAAAVLRSLQCRGSSLADPPALTGPLEPEPHQSLRPS